VGDFWEDDVREWVQNHHHARAILEEISQAHWARVQKREVWASYGGSLSCGRKVCGVGEALEGIADSGQRPQISTGRAVRTIFAMFMARLGSLNAVDRSRPSRFWPSWVGAPPPSADSLGRIAAKLDLETVREANGRVHERLKRSKALPCPRS